jgi:glutamine amidotransferase
MLAILDYGIGNLRSAQKALERVGADARLTTDPAVIADADGVVLPGVGNFGACMRALRAHGLDTQAQAAVERGQPFIGICVGMQMLFEGSDEAPDEPGLGLLPGWVRWLPDSVKRPQMQWNRLALTESGKQHRLFTDLDGAWVYFVHSFAAQPSAAEPDLALATTDYGGTVTAAAGRANVMATQFHPEKSAAAGLRLLGNFVAIAAEGRGQADE